MVPSQNCWSKNYESCFSVMRGIGFSTDWWMDFLWFPGLSALETSQVDENEEVDTQKTSRNSGIVWRGWYSFRGWTTSWLGMVEYNHVTFAKCTTTRGRTSHTKATHIIWSWHFEATCHLGVFGAVRPGQRCMGLEAIKKAWGLRERGPPWASRMGWKVWNWKLWTW